MLHYDMEICYTATAVKQLKAIDPVWAKRIIHKLTAYAVNPAAFANQVKSLKGENTLRLRVGDYRVIFTQDGRVLLVLALGHRREIYD